MLGENQLQPPRQFSMSDGAGRPPGDISSSMDENLSDLWQRLAPELRRTVAALRGSAEAEDILQDVFLAAMKQDLARLEDRRRWLFRVTINRCRQEGRQRVRRRALLARLAERVGRLGRGQMPPEDLARQQEREVVRSALSHLQDDLRIPLVLRYFSGMDSREIAQVLEIPDSTIRGRLRTARRALAAELAKAGYRHD